MKKYVSLAILFVFALSGKSYADPCSTEPNCVALGYNKTVSECSGKSYVVCPFDNTKVFCERISAKKCEAGDKYSPSNSDCRLTDDSTGVVVYTYDSIGCIVTDAVIKDILSPNPAILLTKAENMCGDNSIISPSSFYYLLNNTDIKDEIDSRKIILKQLPDNKTLAYNHEIGLIENVEDTFTLDDRYATICVSEKDSCSSGGTTGAYDFSDISRYGLISSAMPGAFCGGVGACTSTLEDNSKSRLIVSKDNSDNRLSGAYYVDVGYTPIDFGDAVIGLETLTNECINRGGRPLNVNEGHELLKAFARNKNNWPHNWPDVPWDDFIGSNYNIYVYDNRSPNKASVMHVKEVMDNPDAPPFVDSVVEGMILFNQKSVVFCVNSSLYQPYQP